MQWSSFLIYNVVSKRLDGMPDFRSTLGKTEPLLLAMVYVRQHPVEMAC